MICKSMNNGRHFGHPYELKKGFDISWEEGQKIFDSKNIFPDGLNLLMMVSQMLIVLWN